MESKQTKMRNIFKSIFGVREQNISAAGTVFEKLLLAIILFFPLRYIIKLYFEETNLHIPHYAKYTVYFLIIATLFLLYLGIAGRGSRLTKSAEFAFVIAICAVAFFLRVVSSNMLHAEPVSDFLCCFNYAVSHKYAEYMTNYSYLGIYALSIKIFMSIVGLSVFKAQLLTILVTSLIPGIIFITAKAGFQSTRIGLLSALLFAIFPSMIIYTSILSCENIAMFFFALTVMLLVLAWRRRREQKSFWHYIILAGVAAGLMNLYKPILIVVVAALCIAQFIFYICPAVRDCFKKKKVLFTKIFSPILVFVAVYALGSVVTAAGNAVLFHDTGYRPTTKNSYMEMAFAGLYSQGNGVHNFAVREMIEDVKKNSSTSAQSDAKLLQILKDDIGKDLDAFRVFERNKYITDWCDESIYIHWASIKGTPKLDIKKSIFYLVVLPDWFYILLIIGIIAGVAIRLVHNSKGAYPYLLMCSVYFLMSLLFMLIEAQGRYKSTIMPLFCLLAAVGFVEAAKVLQIAFVYLLRTFKGAIKRKG